MLALNIGQSKVGNYIASDSDAQAFITAAGITSDTEKYAIDYMVTQLKGNSLWTKMLAVYPMVGGSTTSFKWNLKDPRDLDAAYRLTFTASPTPSANGLSFNGSTQYADTKLNPFTTFTANNVHVSYYNIASSTNRQCDIGCRTDGSNQEFRVHAPQVGATLLIDKTGSTSTNFEFISSANQTEARGMVVCSDVGLTDYAVYKNGSVVTGAFSKPYTPTTNTLPNATIFLGACNRAAADKLFSNTTCAFASIGTGLTSGEVATFSSIINTFQGILGRNTY